MGTWEAMIDAHGAHICLKMFEVGVAHICVKMFEIFYYGFVQLLSPMYELKIQVSVIFDKSALNYLSLH